MANFSFRSYVLENPVGVFYAIVFSLLINILYVLPSLLIAVIYDRVLTTRSVETLLALSALAVTVFVSVFALDWLRSALVVRVSNKVDLDLIGRILLASLRLRQKGTKADLGSIPSDLVVVRQLAAGQGAFALLDLPWAPLFFLVLWFLHPWFLFLAIGGSLLVVGLSLLTNQLTKSGLRESRQDNSSANRVYTGAMRNADTLIAMGFAAAYNDQWVSHQREWLHKQSHTSDIAAVLTSLTKALRLSLQYLPIAMGAYLVIENQLNPGVMFAASILTGRALAPFDVLSGLLKNIQSAKNAAINLHSVASTSLPPEPSVRLEIGPGNLTLKNLSLRPPGSEKTVITDFTYEFKPGTVTALIGPSSCGKSSLAKAIVGAWKPMAGEVRVDGAEYHQYLEVQRGLLVGYLPQEIDLMDGTIAQNISRFSLADEQHVLAAAIAAGVVDLINTLPDGFDTRLIDGGKNLSGGFRQRIALARAMYQWPSIVVLDEPNSHLDDVGEQALKNSINQMREQRKVVILITHRASILSVVDQIILLQNGKMVKAGPKEAFIKSSSHARSDNKLGTLPR